MKKLKARNENKQDEWKSNFIAISRSFIKKLKVDKVYMDQAINENPEAAQAIHQVFEKTDDMGDFKENIHVFLDCYFKSNIFFTNINYIDLYSFDSDESLSKVLAQGGIKGIKIFKIVNILDDDSNKMYSKVKKLEELNEVLDEKQEIVSMAKILTRDL